MANYNELQNILTQSLKVNSKLEPVGINTHSSLQDFYVYEWAIQETGEIFYVGKGREKRAYEYHHNNLNAEKIRELYNTDVIIVKDNLSEEEALILETQEIIRIKTETPWILTNVATPLQIPNAWAPSKSTPSFSLETAPIIYTSEVEEHYFGIKSKHFETVKLSELKSVYIRETCLEPNFVSKVYNNHYEQYYEETIGLLKKMGIKILSSQYAKSVSAWIYCGNLSLYLYNDEQSKALERIGHQVSTFHLIDVWKELKKQYGDIEIKEESVEINPKNSRKPVSKLPQIKDELSSLRLGEKKLEKGFSFYYEEDYEKALQYFDKAREEGCISPTMFNYYAIIFRKLKDYDNEIDILNEGIERLQQLKNEVYNNNISDFKKRREKAIALLKKTKKGLE